MNEKEIKKILKILDSITWYNGIYEPLLKLKEDILKQQSDDNYFRTNEAKYKFEDFADSQFEIFWMMLVLMFGDYGTSPRSGWLEMKNKDKIIEFIDCITKTGAEELD